MKYKQKSKSKRTKYVKRNALKKVTPAIPSDYPWEVLRFLHEDLAEFLSESDNTLFAKVLRSRDIMAIKELSESWGLQCIIPEIGSLDESRAKYQLTALLKKFQFPASDKAQEHAAIIKFKDAERLCREVNHVGFPRMVRNEELDLSIWSHSRDFIRSCIGETLPDEGELLERARHGPGATLSTVKGRTSSFYKYSQVPYTCTADARAEAISMIEGDERWFRALLTDYCVKHNILCAFSYSQGGPCYSFLNEGIDWEEFWSEVIAIVPGNRIAFVPKDAFIKRSIAIEPALNLMLQLGVDGYVRKRLKTFGVDLDSQEKNQELARQGSLDDSRESYCTLDLAAASDTISLGICKWLLPAQWYDYLMLLRSPVGELGDEVISYEKISSMGNGFTFAIESLIFASLIYGVMKHNQGPNRVDYKDFACFGDDLICRKKYVSGLESILRKSGFKLNSGKSYVNGPVRESCGSDWFRGMPMRPVFFSRFPQSIRDLWSDINRIQRYLVLHFDFEIGQSKVVERMQDWIPDLYWDIQGPLSDEDMDSYMHAVQTEDNSSYSHHLCSFRFKRLIESYRQVKLPVWENFVWRGLMHNLRSSEAAMPWKLNTGKISGNGSRFEVRNMLKTYFSFKLTPVTSWQDNYRC